MILAFLFSLSVAHADTDLLHTVVKSNQAVQMSRKCEDPVGFETPSLDTSDKNLCSVIEDWAKGNPDKFDTRNPYGLCAPTWKSTTPVWMKPEVMEAQKVYGTADFKPQPRADWLKDHMRMVLSPEAKTQILNQALDVREKTAQACCGTDSECLAAVRKVRVSVCESPADQDPSLPDPCEANGGQFSLSTVEQATVLTQMQYSFGVGRYGTPAEVQRVISEAKETLRQNISFGSAFPASGEIRLSPFGHLDGAPLSEIQTLRHEFGHACSFIKRQIASEIGKPHAEDAAMSFYQRYTADCGLHESRGLNAYGPLLKSAGAGAHVMPCLLNLAEQSTDQISSAYFPGSCELSKIEEATAEAFSMLNSDIVPDDYPHRACSRLPSKLHPASTDVFTCLVKADAGFRKKLESKLRCE